MLPQKVRPEKPSSPDVVAFINERRMTPQQECANALSMCAPVLYGFVSFRCGWLAPTWRTTLLFRCAVCHLPISMWYHVRCALSGSNIWPLACSIDNAERRCDQTALHCVSAAAKDSNHSRRYRSPLTFSQLLYCTPHGSSWSQVSVLYAYALSGGSILYLFLTLLFNAWSIEQQWRPEVRPSRNQRNLTIAGIMHCLPLVWRQDWHNLCLACAFILPSSFCFIRYPFGGYSHALFHVLSTGVFHALLASASMSM